MSKQQQLLSNSPSASSGHVTSPMAALLAKSKAQFKILHKGDIVEGIITKITPQEILVDIQAKTEALVLEKERRIMRNLLSMLKVGDTVKVSVLSPESEMGYPIVSLRKFSDDRNWEFLNTLMIKREPVEIIIQESTKGGFLIETTLGVSGFLPNSQTSLSINDPEIIGRRIKAYISELNRALRKVIFSEKKSIDSTDFDQMTQGFKAGQAVEATVTSIANFGLFVSVPSIASEQGVLDGLIHISEISWEKVGSLEELFTSGKMLKAEVISIDRDSKRLDLSLKRLTEDPFEESVKDLAVDQRVTGEVTRISSTGVSVALVNGIEGIIRKEKIPPNKTYTVGDEINLTISQIDKNRRRVYLVPVLLEKPMGYR